MPYIHEHQDWPKFHWQSAVLTGPLAKVRHAQGRHLGRMEGLGFDLQQEANLETLATETQRSWAIEGEVLSKEEVRSSIAGRLGLPQGGLPVATGHVDGVVEMMLDASQRHEEALSADRLFGWHAAIFPTGRSGLNKITVGSWRPESADPMRVVSGWKGQETVHFEAPPASLVEEEMTRFISWFNDPHQEDPVLRAGIAHLWLLTIHPFEDGNGRIARAVADMALARADGTQSRFYSLSAQIEAEKKQYYLELEAAQRGDPDITRWLNWFLECLERAIGRAQESLSSVLLKARIWEQVNQSPVSDRQRVVLNRLLDGFEGHLSTSKYARLAKCSQDTAQRDISDLVERGVLAKNPGGGRSTSFRLRDPNEARS